MSYSFKRSIHWFHSTKILPQDENVCDQAAMNKMKSHVLDSLSSVIHLLFNEDGNCRIGDEFDGLDMKIFFNGVKRLAEMGLSATQRSAQSEITLQRYQLHVMYPDTVNLIECAFPNNARADLYGSELLPLHWAITVRDDLTSEELRKTMTREVKKLSTYNPQRQILGHVLASSKSPNMDFAVELSTILPRIFHVKDVYNDYPLHLAASLPAQLASLWRTKLQARRKILLT
jgi:hypothetical protein